MERRLTAIFAADVVGYSRLMGEDEVLTFARLKALRKDLFQPRIKDNNGRIVKLMGDGLLAEFPSVVEAVECAMALQREVTAREAGSDDDQRIQFRIGINLGDIIVEGSDIYGDGVNVAARLEGLAEPGGISISSGVYENLGKQLATNFDDAGDCQVKNIDRPIHVFHWSVGRPENGSQKPSPPPLPDKPSIAVLPFDNMSGNPDQEFFADGVVEALTAALSRIRSFFVIARNSAFAYKGRHENVRQIGRDLGVAYVLEGSVQSAGGRVRITVQLIETDGGAHIWAEKYDGSLDDIFDLQDRIAAQVAGALQPSIRLAEMERSNRKPPQDLGAYDFTIRAFRHAWMLEKEETGRAQDLLTQALEIDPEYPLALALSAWCHAQGSVYNWTDDIENAKAKSLELAERAANLSADDPLVLTVLGTVHTFSRNYGAARVLLERAVALDPNAAWAWSRLGWLAAYAERSQEAREYFEKALRLSPIDPMNFNNYVGLGSTLQVEGDDDGAASMYFRALDERPHADWIHRNLAPALLGAGRVEEARASFDTLMATYPNFTVKRFKNAMVFSDAVLDRIGEQLAELGCPEV